MDPAQLLVEQVEPFQRLALEHQLDRLPVVLVLLPLDRGDAVRRDAAILLQHPHDRPGGDADECWRESPSRTSLMFFSLAMREQAIGIPQAQHARFIDDDGAARWPPSCILSESRNFATVSAANPSSPQHADRRRRRRQIGDVPAGQLHALVVHAEHGALADAGGGIHQLHAVAGGQQPGHRVPLVVVEDAPLQPLRRRRPD